MDEVIKPCPFCGGEADYHSEKGPTGEVYGWVGCNQCDAMSCYTDTRSMQPEETHPIDAWNTRADAAPTPKADEVEAVARAIAPSRWEVMDHYLAQTKKKYAGENAAYDPDNFKDRESMATAQAAIAALDAARGDAEPAMTPEQIAATSQEILNCIEVAGGRVDPGELIKELRATHGMDNVIEGLQRAIERGKITLDAEGMVVTIASALQVRTILERNRHDADA